MTDDNYSKDQTNQFVFNAEIKKDIEFIKNSILGLGKSVDTYAAQFIPRTEVMEWKADGDKIHADFEKRIRFLEKYAWAAIGIIGLINILVQVLPYIHFTR